MNNKICQFSELMASLPPPLSNQFDALIQAAKQRDIDAIIVLDDDPTGTQTVYDIPVLTTWETKVIEAELDRNTPLFYILTNSRSLQEEKAIALGQHIGANIHQAMEAKQKKCLLISRSDSTLRGHYPAEVTALEKGLHINNSVHLIIPAFFEGGRYTINDIHYVKENDQLIPAAQTPFAKDKVFGYTASNLKEWVVEKTKGAVSTTAVKSLSIEIIRNASTEVITQQIEDLNTGEVCVVNAADYNDLKKVALSVLSAKQQIVLRTAASFVAALDAKPAKDLLNAKRLGIDTQKAGLIIVGSYVPKTSRQLAYLQQHNALVELEIDVEKVLAGNSPSSALFAKQIDEALVSGTSVLVYTSRKLISAQSTEQSLAIGNQVSAFLTQIVKSITVQPEFIIAKGGITSSDIATKSLEMQRAIVLGQILPGIPIWQADKGSKFPNLPYVVFPGNVGDDAALSAAYLKLST